MKTYVQKEFLKFSYVLYVSTHTKKKREMEGKASARHYSLRICV